MGGKHGVYSYIEITEIRCGTELFAPHRYSFLEWKEMDKVNSTVS